MKPDNILPALRATIEKARRIYGPRERAGTRPSNGGESKLPPAPAARPDNAASNAPPKEPIWSQGAFTAAQIQHMQFPPLSWIVPDIIPAEGVTLLCSKPKFGKSWLAYDLCIACTTSRFTLGTIKPAQGDVLYQALEDSKRRLQRRMTKLLPSFSGTWPERLTLKTEWRRLHEGGLDDIRAWHSDTKTKGGQPILVVIDVLAKVRKPVGNRQLYEADYAALGDLHKVAHELALAIVVVHHTRKMAADDLMETVSGSYGVSGAVDTILVLASKSSGTVFDIRGRDVESAELAIEFNKTTCRWRVLGNASEVHASEQRKKILAALEEAAGPKGIAGLIEATGMNRNSLELLLGRMARDGEIKRVGKGRYAHKNYTPPKEPRPDKDEPANPPDKASVASGSARQMPRQMSMLAQEGEKTEESFPICLSVASVRESTDGSGADSSVLFQTDRTDGQRDGEGVAPLTGFETSDLSGPQTDQTDPGETPPAPAFPSVRQASQAQLFVRCEYCGRPSRWGDPVEYHQWGERQVPLHHRCGDAWGDRQRGAGDSGFD
jgi:hypothetical protein